MMPVRVGLIKDILTAVIHCWFDLESVQHGMLHAMVTLSWQLEKLTLDLQ